MSVGKFFLILSAVAYCISVYLIERVLAGSQVFFVLVNVIATAMFSVLAFIVGRTTGAGRPRQPIPSKVYRVIHRGTLPLRNANLGVGEIMFLKRYSIRSDYHDQNGPVYVIQEDAGETLYYAGALQISHRQVRLAPWKPIC